MAEVRQADAPGARIAIVLALPTLARPRLAPFRHRPDHPTAASWNRLEYHADMDIVDIQREIEARPSNNTAPLNWLAEGRSACPKRE